jgi:hypothetical protein
VVTAVCHQTSSASVAVAGWVQAGTDFDNVLLINLPFQR